MLDQLISKSTLKNLAGTTTFEHGQAYFSSNAVQRLRNTGKKITATVQGTRTYQTELSVENNQLAYDCTCPHAADGYFCKHGVALGLAWLAKKGDGSLGKEPHDPWRDIEAYLNTQNPETLIELLLDVAQRDDRLYQSLWLKAERANNPSNVVSAFRQAIDNATVTDNLSDDYWEDASYCADDITPVLASLEELLQPDTAAVLIELAEYAMQRIAKLFNEIEMNDSEGECNDIIDRLDALHLNACLMARPEPAKLAERLFRFKTALPCTPFSFDVETYQQALGAQGLHRYRQLAEAQWRKPVDVDTKGRYNASRATIRRIMEQLAKASGDIDELVAIKASDLSSAYDYLDIAQTWVDVEQPDKALDWAERGLRAFPKQTDNRLRDFLVAAYLTRQRNDEALELTWIQFEEAPTLHHYKKLHNVASPLECWPTQRERALTAVGKFIVNQFAKAIQLKPKPAQPDYSLFVEIALWEKDLDDAWQSACAGFCREDLQRQLAGELEASRPNDAVSLYRRLIAPTVEQTNNAAYDEAIQLIKKMGRLMKMLNQSQDFDQYLAQLRVQYKLKRNFIKLLEIARHSDS